MSTNLQYQLKENNFVVLVQPQMGLSGEFARHLPLSLLYVAAPLKKMGIEGKNKNDSLVLRNQILIAVKILSL